MSFRCEIVPCARITSGISSYLWQTLWDLWSQALSLLSQAEQFFRKPPKEKTNRDFLPLKPHLSKRFASPSFFEGTFIVIAILKVLDRAN